MRLHNDRILLRAPLLLVYVGVQVVVPPLPALLPDPSRQLLSNETPILRPVLTHQPHH